MARATTSAEKARLKPRKHQPETEPHALLFWPPLAAPLVALEPPEEDRAHAENRRAEKLVLQPEECELRALGWYPGRQDERDEGPRGTNNQHRHGG